MNLSTDKRSPVGGQQNAGAVCHSAASAHPDYAVGDVGFGRCWQDEEPGLRALYEEAQAQIAIYEVERGILEKELRRLRVADLTLQSNEQREVLAEIVTWVEDDLRETVDSSYRKAVERGQQLTEGIR